MTPGRATLIRLLSRRVDAQIAKIEADIAAWRERWLADESITVGQYFDRKERLEGYLATSRDDREQLASGRIPDMAQREGWRQAYVWRRRRKFPKRLLAATTLASPGPGCRKCGYQSDSPLELDHMVEMVAGGADAPYNLAYLCSGCHRWKPFYSDLDDPIAYRFLILDWLSDGDRDFPSTGGAPS